MLAAAAQQWSVPQSELTTAGGVVTHARVQAHRDLRLAVGAARDACPCRKRAAIEAALKNPRDFKIIGKRIRGVDNLDIVTGRPVFSIDVAFPNMLYAVFEKCAVFGGKAVSANLDEIKKLPGIRHAFIVEPARTGQQLARVGRGDRRRQLVAGQRRAHVAEGHVGRGRGRDAEQRRLPGAGARAGRASGDGAATRAGTGTGSGRAAAADRRAP